MKDITAQKPFSTNQIEQTKPNVPRSTSVLSGYIANSFNGGHSKTIAFKQVMAGEKHKEYRLALNIQMLTPLTPAYQQLKCTIRSYFVPNSRVWKNAEKYTAQKGGSTEIKIEEIPNLFGKKIPKLGDNGLNLNDTSAWRDAFISSYIPRINPGFTGEKPLPKVSVLPLRGRIAIWNDLERNREYDSERMEFDGDTVTNEEWECYLPIEPQLNEFYQMRSRREDNYYTNYRTEMQGFMSENPIQDQGLNWNANAQLVEWAQWESKINEARAQAENAQKTDWQIIAELRGSKLLTEGKVQMIGQKTFNLNYSAVTQNTYNNNEDINPQFKVMGKQGAYSYTNVNIPVYAGFEFNEEGYVHIIATVSADTAFINGFDRLELNCTPLEQYRPDMKDDKLDVLKFIEMCTIPQGNLTYGQMFEEVIGFKRKYSEYFKLPTIIRSDMEETEVKELVTNASTMGLFADGWIETDREIYPNSTYQFFEENVRFIDEIKIANETMNGYIRFPKNIWKDYTDIMINKNLAIKEDVFGLIQDSSETTTWVGGQNQIFFVGVATCTAELPIDPAIIDNYTTYGEH